MHRDDFGYVIIILVLLLIAAAPFIDGFYFKQHYLNLLAGISREYGPKITVQEYHLGWYKSDVKLLIETNPTSEQNTSEIKQSTMPTSIIVIQHISHGPVVHNSTTNQWSLAQAVVDSTFYLPEPMNTNLLGSRANDGILHINSLITFDNEAFNLINTPSINFKFPDESIITWQGLNGNSFVKFGRDYIKRVKANYNIEPIILKDVKGDILTIQTISIQYETSRNAAKLWDGNYAFSLPQLTIDKSDNQNLELNNLSAIDTFGVDSSNLFFNQLQINLKKLTTPVLTINSVDAKFSENNLNALALSDYLNKVRTLRSEPMTPAAFQSIRDSLAQLITPTTSVNEHVLINTSAGNFISEGQLSWLNGASTADDVINNATFNINIRASIALINKIFELTAPQPVTIKAIAQTPEQKLLAQIDQWANQNQISVNTAINLKDLVNTHIAAQAFVTNIDEFVTRKDLSPALANQIKTQYSMITAPNQSTQNSKPTPQIANATTIVTPVNKPEQEFQSWLQQGYIKKDNEDYVIIITRKNGVIKINDIPLSAPSTTPNTEPLPESP